MSVEYSVKTGYGLIVADNDSDIALAIRAAYCDGDPTMNELDRTRLRIDYPSIDLSTSEDNWSDSIARSGIFYIKDSCVNVNPKDNVYDAFYLHKFEPDAELKEELNEFMMRFDIKDKPGFCIWSSIF